LDLLNYNLFSGWIEKHEEKTKEYNKWSLIIMSKQREILENHKETFDNFIAEM
jgi:hypothetical protein